MTNKQKALRSLISVGVDGANCDAFLPIYRLIEKQPVEAKRVTFTLEELYNALKFNSNKWQKQISEYNK